MIRRALVRYGSHPWLGFALVGSSAVLYGASYRVSALVLPARVWGIATIVLLAVGVLGAHLAYVDAKRRLDEVRRRQGRE